MLLQTKKFKPITNGNIANSGIISLIDDPFQGENLKKNESLNVNFEQKNSTAASPKLKQNTS